MKFFLGFLLVCFFAGLLLPQRFTTRQAAFVLSGVCAMVLVGYFFFNQV